MDFNILNLLSQYLKPNYHTQNNANNTYNSDYPDVFFTKEITHGLSNQNSTNNSDLSSQINNFNFSGLANLLPLFLNKSDNTNLSNILENLNPQLSKIATLFSKKEKKSSTKKEESAPSIIDLSNYTEIS